MGRKNKNKGNKNKSAKKPNSNKSSDNNKKADVPLESEKEPVKMVKPATDDTNSASASAVNQPEAALESPPYIPDGRQSRACFHRSLRDEYEQQQRLSLSSEASVSSSAERAFVAEIENAIGRGSAAEDTIPRLDLRFVNDSESEYSERTPKTQNGLSGTNVENREHGGINREGLSYTEIKSQSPQKLEDPESGIGTCSNTEVTYGEERNTSFHSYEVIEKVGDEVPVRESGSEVYDMSECRLKLVRNQEEQELSSESMSSMPEDIQDGTEDMIDLVSRAQGVEVRSMNTSGELKEISFTHANIHANMYQVTAISEPNLVRCDSEDSASLVDDTSDGQTTEHRNSPQNSTPRSFAEFGSTDIPIELVTAQGNFRSEHSAASDVILNKLSKSNPELQPLEDGPLDSSVDNLPIDNVTFTDQGVSIYEEIKRASNEEIDSEQRMNDIPLISVEDTGNIRVLEIKEQDQFPPLDSGNSFTAKSPASSLKEGDQVSNRESVTDYGSSPSEGSKTLSHGDSASELRGRTPSDVIERLPEFMQSAPGLLEAQQLEESYREFMSSSDISDKDHSATEDVEISSTGKYEQLSKFEYKICYDMDEKQPVHPGKVLVMGDMPNEDLNAAFQIESSNENVAESSQHVEILKEVEAIIQDREHVSTVLTNMNQEIENLRMENRHLYGEMTMYRNACKQYRGKSDSMGGYIKNLRSHVKSLEIQMADINSQRQNMKTGFTMTDNVVLLTASTQVIPVMYDAHIQTENSALNKGVQVDNPIKSKIKCVDNFTSTVDDHQGLPLSSGPFIGESTVTEESQKKVPAKASFIVDKLLQQMTNITENQTSLSQDFDPDEVESPDKWRRLAMMPISADHIVLQLQKSLGSATVEFDEIETRLKEKQQELKQLEKDLQVKEDFTTDDLQKMTTECESWQMKYEGDHTEVEMLRQKVEGLERNLMLTQMERDRLKEDVEKIIKEPKDDSTKGMKNTKLEETLEKMQQLETEKKDLTEEVLKYQSIQQEELEKVTSLEKTLKDTEERKSLLENELTLIKEEYGTLQKAVQSLESVFQLKAEKETDKEPEDFSKIAQEKIEELKRHVFEPRSVPKARTSDTSSVTSTSSGAVSLHADIIQQSELVLHILKETGDIEDDDVNSKDELVNWTQVRNSIENQLSGKSDQKSPTDTPEKPLELHGQSENEDYCGANDPEVKSHLNELAEAIGSDLGVKVNIVIGDSNIVTTTDTDSSPEKQLQDRKEKRKMEIDRKNTEYESMRKKRLSMLVQAYTGRETEELMNGSHSRDERSYHDHHIARPEEKSSQQSLEEKAKAFRKELLKDMPPYNTNTATLPKSGYFSMNNETDEHPPAQRNSVLRQSQEDLDHLLSKSKVPRVCMSRKSSTDMLAASTTDSTTPYSYRLKREIYPHKKGYLPVDQFYEEKEKYNRDEEAPRDYNDTYYGDYHQNGYPHETNDYHDEYTAGYGQEDQYYDTSNIKDKKEALVKLRAKLLKKKRQLARERDRRSPREETSYATYDDIHGYETKKAINKTWSPQEWKEQDKSPDLNSIKQSIRDYTSHLRTKYSKLNLNSSDHHYTRPPTYAWDENGDTLKSSSSNHVSHTSEAAERSTYTAPLYRSAAPLSSGSVSQYDSGLQAYDSPLSSAAQRDHAYSTTRSSRYDTKYSSPSDVSTWTSSYGASGQIYGDTQPSYTRESYTANHPTSTSSGYTQKAEKSVFVSYEENTKPGKSPQDKYNVKFTEIEDSAKDNAPPFPVKKKLSDQELYHREMQKTLETNYGAKNTDLVSGESRDDAVMYKSQTTYSSPAYDWAGKENGYGTNDYDKPDNYLTTQERDLLTKHNLHLDTNVGESRADEKNYDLADETSLLQRRFKEDFPDTLGKYSTPGLDKYRDQKKSHSQRDNNYSFTKRSSSEPRYKPPRETQLYLDDTLTNYSSRYDVPRENTGEDRRAEELPERTFFDYSKEISVEASSQTPTEPKLNGTGLKVSSDLREAQISSSYAYRNGLESQGGPSSTNLTNEDDKHVDYISKYLRSPSPLNREHSPMSDSFKSSRGYETSAVKARDLSSSSSQERGVSKSGSKVDGSSNMSNSVYDNNKTLDVASTGYLSKDTSSKAVSSKFEGSSKGYQKNKYYTSEEKVASKPPLPTRATSKIKSSYSQSGTYKSEQDQDAAKNDTTVKTYKSSRPESPYRASSPYISSHSEGSSNKYTSKVESSYRASSPYISSQSGESSSNYTSTTESPYRSSSPYVSGVSASDSKPTTYTGSKVESLHRLSSPHVNSQAENRASTYTTSVTESPYRSNSPFLPNPEKPSPLTSSEIDSLKSKYDKKSSSVEDAVKPVLSKEYLDYMNKSSSMDSHMMEINQRKGIHNERKLSQDDACSVTSSAVSDADFVVTSTGDIVKRKSKTAKKIDKARNIELQMMSYDGPDKHEVLKSHTEQSQRAKDKKSDYKSPTTSSSRSTKYSSGSGENYSQKTKDFLKEEVEKWKEPKRHFGLREDEDDKDPDRDELLWREPKVYTVTDSQSRGYVDTGATGLSSSHLTGRLDKDNEWFRSQKTQEDSVEVGKETKAKVNVSSKVPGDQTTLTKETSEKFASSSEVLENSENKERNQRRVHWEKPALRQQKSNRLQQQSNKPLSHSYSSNRHPVSKVDKNSHSVVTNVSVTKDQSQTTVSTKSLDDDRSKTAINSREGQTRRPRGRFTDQSIPIADISFSNKDEPLKLAASTGDARLQNVSSRMFESRGDLEVVIPHASKTASVNVNVLDVRDSPAKNGLSETDQTQMQSGSVSEKSKSKQSESLPKDPYERQQLLTDIIDKYTKDMDQCYIANRDQKKPRQHGVKKRNSSITRSSEEGSPNRGDNTSGYSSHDTAEDEYVPSQTNVHKTTLSSYRSSVSRSPSHSPSNSRKSSGERDIKSSRIPVSRSLSRERDEGTGKSPTHSRKSSVESDYRSQIPVKIKSLSGVSEEEGQKDMILTEHRKKEQELASLEDKTRQEIDKIMRKYNMYNEDWEKPQDDKVMKELLG